MNKKQHYTSNNGACSASGTIHGVDCSCGPTEALLAGPTAAYMESRRAFFRRLLVGGLSVAALPLLEPHAEADIFTPSANDQKKAGDQAAAQVMQQYHVVNDSRASHFSQVGSRLVSALSSRDRGPWDYRFHVIQSSDINAFALPGGNIFLFTGLMDRIHSDDALAAVTGHEMTHVRKQHWAKAVANETKRQLGLAVVLGLAHANNTWRQIAGGADSLLYLRYSRQEEDEADAGGLQDMVQTGYDPHGMLDLFHTLLTATKGGGPPEFLSTHPLTKERIAHTQQRIAKLQGQG